MIDIDKRYGSVAANRGVNLSVEAATVHGLVGENGAGKSTLMAILYGLQAPDAGRIEIDGTPVRIRHAADAIALGLGLVHQHFMLVETLSAIDNVMLGAEPHPLLRRADAMVRPRLRGLMAATGLEVDLDRVVADLSVGDRQRLEILKVLYRGARILILDEPTAVLTPQETDSLFEVLGRLREQGTTVVLITHKLAEVMRLCDRVTVMRGGRVVHECAIADASVPGLALAMVGRQVQLGRPARPSTGTGPVRLDASRLTVRDTLNVLRLDAVGLTLRAGEIVGVAGVAGNGQSELLEVLSGLRTPDAGTLQVGGRAYTPRRWIDPRGARRVGLAHVPEDRHARALVMRFAAWESAILGYEGLDASSTRAGWMRGARVRAATRALMQRFDVRPPDPTLASANFSGGNQQKLVLAREIGQAPGILLVGQPTRGVDIGAIEFIHGQLRRLRDAGGAVLLVSSELDEILALADRVLVMNEGRITGELAIAECTEERVGLLMCASVRASA